MCGNSSPKTGDSSLGAGAVFAVKAAPSEASSIGSVLDLNDFAGGSFLAKSDVWRLP